MATPLVRGWTGVQGSGKTFAFVQQVDYCLALCVRLNKQPDRARSIGVAINTPLSDEVEAKYGVVTRLEDIGTKGLIFYWSDRSQLSMFRGMFVFIDEVSIIADATQWADLDAKTKKWLRQLRKHSCKVFFTAQDFKTVDIAFRRITNRLTECRKLCGSDDPSLVRPVIKRPWGILWRREVKRASYLKETVEYDYEGFFPQFGLITKKWCNYFDTLKMIEPSDYPPLRHVTRTCKTCGFVKVTHD